MKKARCIATLFLIVLLCSALSSCFFFGPGKPWEEDMLRDTFFGTDYLAERGVADFPTPKLEGSYFDAEKNILYLNLSREEFDARMREILATDAWIIDGNYSRTIESRIAACDTVFLFDLPTEICLEGVVSRIGKERCEMPWVETELDLAFKEQIENFPTKELPITYALLEKYKEGKTVVIFCNRAQADAFLEENIP